MTQATEGKTEKKKRRWGFRRTIALLLFVFIGMIGLLFLAQFVINQNWGTERVAKQLSSALNTEVTIEEIKLNIFKGLETKGVLIKDYKQDTLIYVNYLNTGLEGAIRSAFNRQLVLTNVEIDKGLFNLVTYNGDPYKNLTMTFNPNVDQATNKEKAQLLIDLGRVNLKDFEFRNHDYNRGSEEFYNINRGEIDVDLLDIAKDSVVLGQVNFDSTDIRIHIFTPEGMDTTLTAAEINEAIDSTRKRNPFFLSARKINFNNGDFQLDNNFRSPNWNQNYQRINYDHLLLNEVNISVDNFELHDLAFAGQNLFLAFENPAGFVLEHLRVDNAIVDSTQVALQGVDLLTPTSTLGDTVTFKFNCYESWRDFNNQVFIDADLVESQLSFRDIMMFAPALYDNTFFINSENQILELEGNLKGRVNSLKAFDVKLRAGDNISFEGDISTRDITVKDEELLGLDIKELKFDILSLENLIPNLDIPPTFEKLGDIRYKGRFDGYFQDFVSYGGIRTNLGTADLDMRLDLKPGKDKANYSGKMSLQNFDLATWMENGDFGKLSMVMQVKEGKGLTIESATATVDGEIKQLDFKGYTYENLLVDGKLNKSLFDGMLIADSEDAKLTFNGKIANLDSVPEFKFYADIDHVRLKSLKLSNKEFDFGGIADISLTGLNWDELIGTARLENAWTVFNGQDTMLLDEVDIEQLNTPGGRHLKMNAHFGQIDVSGVYDIPKIHQDLLNIIGNNHPQLSQLIKIDSLVTVTESRKDYNISVDFNEKFDLIKYFTGQQYRLGPGQLDAYVTTANESIKYQSFFQSIGLGNWDVDSVELSLVNDGPLMVYTLHAAQVRIKEKPWFDSLYHVANLQGDSGTIKLSYVDPQGIFESVEIDAGMIPQSQELLVQFAPSALWFGRDKWTFKANNSLLIKKQGLVFDNFKLASDSAYITIDDLNGNRGISATMQDFSSNVLDSLTKLKAFDFKGRFDASLIVEDLFDFKGIEFSLRQDETIINDKKRGSLNIEARGQSIQKGLDIDLQLKDGESGLSAQGFFKGGKDESPPTYKFDVNADKFPLEILEDIITSGISQTKGQVSGDVVVEGSANNFTINGNLFVPNGQSRVDYLGVTYYFENQTIGFRDDYLDFNNAVFRDSLNNTAQITGGLRHSSLKDWSLDLSISSDRLIGLNTTKAQNPNYYGFVVGAAEIDFYGSMERPYIDVVATTASPSELVIPITYGNSDVQTGFVEFVKMDTTNVDTARQRAGTLTGLELDMKLTVTEAAKTQIIFDEQAGDILEGYGRGNINVQIRRTGEMSVYGDYEIEQGDYLFTLLNFVNKPFVVKRGGTIRWTGDPIDAQINIEAEYKGLTASPYPLIQEYITTGQNTNLESEANRRTRVDLTMGLSGSLLSPRITFDIALPNLVGELNTYVQNKLQALENDQEQLNQQVFGLVVFGSFLPSNQTTALVNNIGASTINTFSEFLSTQLSGLFSSLLNNAVDDVGFISGIDVDLAYVQQQYELQSNQESFREGEYQFRLKNRLWNDKWVITLGGDYGSQSLFNSDPYFNPETVIEWNTPVPGLKLRVYYRAEQNFQGQSQKVGGGIRYRKEFDSFMDFQKAVKKESKKDS